MRMLFTSAFALAWLVIVVTSTCAQVRAVLKPNDPKDGIEPREFVAFSPDGKRLVSGDGHGIHLWDVARAKYIAPIVRGTGPYSRLNHVAFTSDGKQLFYSAGGTALKSLDIQTEKVRKQQEVAGYALSAPRGKVVAAADTSTRTIKVFDRDNWKQKAAWVYSTARTPISDGFALSEDGRFLATCCDESEEEGKCVKVWDIESGQVFAHSAFAIKVPHWVAFSPNGKLLAVSNTKDGIGLYEVAKGKLRWVRSLETSGGTMMVFSPDGTMLAETYGRRVWDVASGKVKATFPGTYWESMAFSPDGKTLACATRECVLLLDLEGAFRTRKPLATLEAHADGVDAVSIGAGLAATTGGKVLALWDLTDRARPKKMSAPPEAAHEKLKPWPLRYNPRFSPDGKRLAFTYSASPSGTVTVVWDVKTKRYVFATDLDQIATSYYSLGAPAFSPDGAFLGMLAGPGNSRDWRWWKQQKITANEAILFFDIKSGKMIHKPVPKSWDYGQGYCFTDRGKQLAVGMSLWDIAKGESAGGKVDHSKLQVVAAPDASTVWATDGVVYRWDAESEKISTPFTAHNGKSEYVYASAMVLAPGGKVLATACADAKVRLWDAHHDRLLLTLPHAKPVTCLDISADGKTLVSGDKSGTLYIWDITPETAGK